MAPDPSTPGPATNPGATPSAPVFAERLPAAPYREAALQRDLDRITSTISTMAALDERALLDCMTALQDRNRSLAYAVIIRDQNIDALEKELDRLCLEFLVRQQPAGKPLRLAYSAIKINTELERVGDYAESIAHQTTKLCALDVSLPIERFRQIADLVIPMLRDAIRAFVTADAALAAATMPMESTVDSLKGQMRRDLVQLYKDNRLPFEALDPCLLITRRLERVSDQARNICKETLYLCTGEYAKHQGSDTFRLLFLDQHNAGASLMAEAIAESLHPPRFTFCSAGLDPKPAPPAVLAFMREQGLDLSRRPPKSLTEVPHLDLYHVVVVLAPEVKQVFPRLPHKVVFLDWPVTDPATIQTSPADIRSACETTFATLTSQIRDLVRAIAGLPAASNSIHPS
jgi:phosphate transport system protein